MLSGAVSHCCYELNLAQSARFAPWEASSVDVVVLISSFNAHLKIKIGLMDRKCFPLDVREMYNQELLLCSLRMGHSQLQSPSHWC